MKPRESDIQRMILARLWTMDGMFAYRMNTGAARAGKNFIRFGIAGQADIIGCYLGRFIAIEVKTERGKLSTEQVNYRKRVTDAGGIYIEARTWEDVTNGLSAINT